MEGTSYNPRLTLLVLGEESGLFLLERSGGVGGVEAGWGLRP